MGLRLMVRSCSLLLLARWLLVLMAAVAARTVSRHSCTYMYYSCSRYHAGT